MLWILIAVAQAAWPACDEQLRWRDLSDGRMPSGLQETSLPPNLRKDAVRAPWLQIDADGTPDKPLPAGPVLVTIAPELPVAAAEDLYARFAAAGSKPVQVLATRRPPSGDGLQRWAQPRCGVGIRLVPIPVDPLAPALPVRADLTWADLQLRPPAAIDLRDHAVLAGLRRVPPDALRVVERSTPKLPEPARGLGWQRCVARVAVGRTGTPEQVVVSGCQAVLHPILEANLGSWRWAPPELAASERAVEVRLEIEIDTDEQIVGARDRSSPPSPSP